MTLEEKKFSGPKAYLEKSFLEELNYKIWTTKGARFVTNRRLLTKSDLSNKAIGFLSSYLIIFGLLSVYEISNDTFLNQNILAFGSTSLSILLLLFSQLEAAQDYKLKAKSFHDCALELSHLYNELRMFKTLNEMPNNEQIKIFCSDISQRYQNILGKYENHENIDFDKFKTSNKDFFELNYYQVLTYNWVYYRRTKMLYHLLIILPPLGTVIYSLA